MGRRTRYVVGYLLMTPMAIALVMGVIALIKIGLVMGVIALIKIGLPEFLVLVTFLMFIYGLHLVDTAANGGNELSHAQVDMLNSIKDKG